MLKPGQTTTVWPSSSTASMSGSSTVSGSQKRPPSREMIEPVPASEENHVWIVLQHGEGEARRQAASGLPPRLPGIVRDH